MWARTRQGRLADISCLSALTSLQELWPSIAKETGGIKGANAFTGLLLLDRRLTQFLGDVGCLIALANLKKLGLFDTQVTGEIGSVGAHKVLGVLATPAMMTGVVYSPSALLNRQELFSAAKESAAGLAGPLSRAARLGILSL